MSAREGRETPMVFSAAFTVRCRVWRQEMVLAPYRTVMQLVRTPDGASVERVHAGGRGSCSSQFPQKVETLLCFFGQRKVNLIATLCFLECHTVAECLSGFAV